MAGGHKAMGVAKRTCAHAHNVLVDVIDLRSV